MEPLWYFKWFGCGAETIYVIRVLPSNCFKRAVSDTIRFIYLSTAILGISPILTIISSTNLSCFLHWTEPVQKIINFVCQNWESNAPPCKTCNVTRLIKFRQKKKWDRWYSVSRKSVRYWLQNHLRFEMQTKKNDEFVIHFGCIFYRVCLDFSAEWCWYTRQKNMPYKIQLQSLPFCLPPTRRYTFFVFFCYCCCCCCVCSFPSIEMSS